MKISRITISRIALVLYLCLVAFLCFGKFPQSNNIPKSIFGIRSDKVVHCIMFIPLVPLLVQSVVKKGASKGRIALIILLSILIGIGLAAATEYGQGLTNYRYKDMKDLSADIVGIAIGAIAMILPIILKRTSK